jgi:hypothetical protein
MKAKRPTPVRPTVTEILRQFFDPQFEFMPPVRRARAVRIELRLREFLEKEGERGLVGFDRVLLRTERQVGPAGAFCRLMHADDMVAVLGGFVSEAWLLPDPVDRRLQVRLTGLLLKYVVDCRLLPEGAECMVYEAEARINRAR